MSEKFSINCLPTGPLEVNTYIITSDHDNVIIDPGGDVQEILANIDQSLKTIILLTHSHFDHLGGINELLSALPDDTEYLAHEECARRASNPELNLSAMLTGAPYSAFATTRTLTDKEEFTAAGTRIIALHTPGHAPGHLCFYLPEKKILFSGDTIFNHSIGRSDLPGGNGWDLIENCRHLLSTLPPETLIYPGHGSSTTVQQEKDTNPYL